MSRLSGVIFVLCIVFALALTSRADIVLVNTLGPRSKVTTLVLLGLCLGPITTMAIFNQAMQFTSSVTTNLKRIDLAAGFLGGGETNSLTLQLAVDNNSAQERFLRPGHLGRSGLLQNFSEANLKAPLRLVGKSRIVQWMIVVSTGQNAQAILANSLTVATITTLPAAVASSCTIYLAHRATSVPLTEFYVTYRNLISRRQSYLAKVLMMSPHLRVEDCYMSLLSYSRLVIEEGWDHPVGI